MTFSASPSIRITPLSIIPAKPHLRLVPLHAPTQPFLECASFVFVDWPPVLQTPIQTRPILPPPRSPQRCKDPSGEMLDVVLMIEGCAAFSLSLALCLLSLSYTHTQTHTHRTEFPRARSYQAPASPPPPLSLSLSRSLSLSHMPEFPETPGHAPIKPPRQPLPRRMGLGKPCAW